MTDQREFVRSLPKAELHLHLEGSLEPEMLLALAESNKVALSYGSIEEVRAAYRFSNLQDFLDIYYQGMSVLRTEEDFEALTHAYLRRISEDGVVHAEVFFDPQGHTGRGVALQTVVEGIRAGLARGEAEFGITTRLILCFLRHLSEADALQTFAAAQRWFDDGSIIGVGLDSSEVGHPPSKFRSVFAKARQRGLKLVAHAGEEGPPAYVAEALDLLQVDRIDHGNRALEDPSLVDRLRRDRIPLTVCPLSNLRLCNVSDMASHPIGRMLDAGLVATVNSDDPAYFGGYVLDNFMAVIEGLGLDRGQVVRLAANSISASFLPEDRKAHHLRSLDGVAGASDRSSGEGP